MPPAQKPTGAEGAERALSREQPVTADAATPTPVNNESAGAEGAEFIAQDLSQDPPGNDDLLTWCNHECTPTGFLSLSPAGKVRLAGTLLASDGPVSAVSHGAHIPVQLLGAPSHTQT